jgi:hypothetical protein
VALWLLCACHTNAYAQGAALWATHCDGCHGTPPSLPQRNAAGASNIIDWAISNVSAMGAQSARTALERTQLATYIASVFSASHSTSVNYQGSVSVAFNNIQLNGAVNANGDGTPASGSITSVGTATGGAPTSPNTVSYSSTQVTYNHNATNCNADSVDYRGTGPGGNTSNRTLNITVNPPPIPTISSSTTAAANWNTSTSIPVTVANSGTSFPTSISITTGANNGGTTTPVGTTSITYQSNGTNFFPTETFSYRVNGPCGNQSATVNMTVNVSLPAPSITRS